MKKKDATSRLDEEIFEMADDMQRLGILDDATHQEITMRKLDLKALVRAEPI